MVDFDPSPHLISQVKPMVHKMCITLTILLENCNAERIGVTGNQVSIAQCETMWVYSIPTAESEVCQTRA